MRRIVLSAKAQADIEAITDFIAKDNPAQALRFVEALRVRCLALEVHPLQGRPAPEIGEGVRFLVIRSYVVLYRAFDDQVAFDRTIPSPLDWCGCAVLSRTPGAKRKVIRDPANGGPRQRLIANRAKGRTLRGLSRWVPDRVSLTLHPSGKGVRVSEPNSSSGVRRIHGARDRSALEFDE